jgi:hypothetical protein
MIKLTTEYVRNVVESLGGELVGEYNGGKNDILVKCSCANIFPVRYHNFIKDGHSHKCPECGRKVISNKLSSDPKKIESELNNLGYFFIDNNNYNNEKTILYLIDEDGYKYSINYATLNIAISNNYNPQRFSKKNPFLFDNISLWLKNEKKNYKLMSVEIDKKRIRAIMLCEKCNNQWNPAMGEIFSGRGCPYCSHTGGRPHSKNNFAIKNPYLLEEWDYENNKISPYDYRPKSNKRVSWICKQCGHKWVASLNDRSSGKGCLCCNMSGGAKRIYFYLKNKRVSFIPEFCFEDLLSDFGNPLKYDFCVFNRGNIFGLIEFDGGQHDHFVPIFHKDMNDFEKRREYDLRKDEYANQHGYNLIRISFNRLEEIEEILDGYFNNYN